MRRRPHTDAAHAKNATIRRETGRNGLKRIAYTSATLLVRLLKGQTLAVAPAHDVMATCSRLRRSTSPSALHRVVAGRHRRPWCCRR